MIIDQQNKIPNINKLSLHLIIDIKKMKKQQGNN